jgi:hypothetical protein
MSIFNIVFDPDIITLKNICFFVKFSTFKLERNPNFLHSISDLV